VGIKHEVDGKATAQVWIGMASDLANLHCVYDDRFVASETSVVLGVADDSWRGPVQLGAGAHRLRVLVDEIESPELVGFVFTKLQQS
jgi:hypothetical protein